MTKTIAYHSVVFCVLLTIGVTLSILIDAWTVDDGWWEGVWTGLRYLTTSVVWFAALFYQREITTWFKHP